MRDSMVFYRSFYEAIKELPAEDFKLTVETLMEYALNQIEMTVTGVAKTVFILAKPQIDKNNQRYENGCKGGKPRKAKAKKEAAPKPVAEPESVEEEKPDETPCAGKFLLNDSTEFKISQKQAEEYQRLYPAVNVQQELRAIEAWCLSNPKNRKTRQGALKFVNSWLCRAQNMARKSSETEDSPKTNIVSKTKNRFTNFHQRTYDYDELEKMMLTNQPKGAACCAAAN